MTTFYPASEKAMKVRKKRFQAECESIEVGQSFSVGITEIKLETLRPHIFVIGKKLGKRFRVVLHEDHKIYEIARIA